MGSGWAGLVASGDSQTARRLTLSSRQDALTGTNIVFGIYTVGNVVSFFPSILLPDWIGRRWAMFIGNAVLIIGCFINGYARNMDWLLAGRFLVGMGGTMAGTAAKVYLAELSSPWNRGLTLGLQNCCWYVGNIVATGVAIPYGRRSDDMSWRVPFLLQMTFAAVNFLFIMACPESPRWLYARGHKDKAARILADLHSRDNDTQSPLVQMTMAEIDENVSLSGADKRWWDFRPIWRTRGDRYRFGLCIVVACWGQLSGNGMVSYFMPSLLQQAGITSDDRQRVLTLVSSVVAMIGAMSGAALIDHLGRRPLMLGSEIWAAACLGIIAGLVRPGGVQNTARSNAGIAFIMLWNVFFSFGWTPLQGLYPAEILSYEVRAKGLALQGWFAAVFSLINTFGIPDAMKALGWKVYFIFMCWDVVGVVVIYLFVVETKQLSLEELDDVFDAPYPKKRSIEVRKEAKRRAREHLDSEGGLQPTALVH